MTQFPSTLDQGDAIATIGRWIDVGGDMVNVEAGRPYRMEYIRRWVMEGGVKIMLAIEAADAGCEEADLVLRETAIDLIDRGQFGPDASAALRAYTQRALMRPPSTPPKGRDASDNWLRDVVIATLVALSLERWGLPATRNRASKRPSACSLVADALGTRRINVGERRVEKIWGGLAGALAAHQRWKLSAPDQPS